MACFVLLPLLFGLVEGCLAFYYYNFVAEAAREATRYAAVRGSTSCTNTPGLANCNLNTSAAVQTYVRSLGFPGANGVTVTATWLQTNNSSPASWTVCATPCNQPQNEVKVFVQYTLPIAIPFFRARSFSFGSTSEMVISQ